MWGTGPESWSTEPVFGQMKANSLLCSQNSSLSEVLNFRRTHYLRAHLIIMHKENSRYWDRSCSKLNLTQYYSNRYWHEKLDKKHFILFYIVAKYGSVRFMEDGKHRLINFYENNPKPQFWLDCCKTYLII